LQICSSKGVADVVDFLQIIWDFIIVILMGEAVSGSKGPLLKARYPVGEEAISDLWMALAALRREGYDQQFELIEEASMLCITPVCRISVEICCCLNC
jgi:hypothetical protein